jgi:hypothetical protein
VPETPPPAPAPKPEATSPGRQLSDRDVEKIILLTPSRGGRDAAGRAHEDAASHRLATDSVEVRSGVADTRLLWCNMFFRCSYAV